MANMAIFIMWHANMILLILQAKEVTEISIIMIIIVAVLFSYWVRRHIDWLLIFKNNLWTDFDLHLFLLLYYRYLRILILIYPLWFNNPKPSSILHPPILRMQQITWSVINFELIASHLLSYQILFINIVKQNKLIE